VAKGEAEKDGEEAEVAGAELAGTAIVQKLSHSINSLQVQK